MPQTALLDGMFAALADPTRRDIVIRLAEGDATVNEIAAPYDVTLPAISRHLKVLEQAGLITRRRDGRRRPCSLRTEALVQIASWALNTKEVWEQRLDGLERHLRQQDDPKESE